MGKGGGCSRCILDFICCFFKNNHMHLAVQKSIWFSYTVNSGKQ